MANRKHTIAASLDSVYLRRGGIEVYKPEDLEEPSSASISVEVKLQEVSPGNTEKFQLSLKAKIRGRKKDAKDEPDKEDRHFTFVIFCEFTSFFKFNKGSNAKIEDVAADPVPYALQVYPVVRQFFEGRLAEIGTTAINTPWNVGMNNLDLSRQDPKE